MYGRHTQIANNLSQKIKLLDKEELKVNDISTNISITAIQNGIKKTKISTIPEIINEIINEIIDPLSKLVCWV
jgi:tRNA A37 threonylcarbamoyladenosine dehydratase